MRLDVRMKTGSSVQLAGGHHADNRRGPCSRNVFNAKARRRKEFQPRMNTDGHGFGLPQENAWNAEF